MKVSQIQSQNFRNIPAQQREKEPKKREFIDKLMGVVQNQQDVNDCVAVPRGIFKAYLWIMGDVDEEPSYYEECVNLIETLGIRNVAFLGRVDVKEYLPEMDLLLLSSISEGQPLAVLEGMAAGKPFVCTNVGDCKGLLEGKVGDELGRAGYVVPVMDSKAMADVIVHCSKDKNKLVEMGQVGRKRVETYYRSEDFLNRYKSIYGLYGGNK